MDRLSLFLRHAAGRRFVTWEFDCVFWLADWVKEITGKDPAAKMRGLSAAALNGCAFPIITARIARNAGLRSTKSPGLGDIAILRAKPGNEPYGAIKTLRGWAVLDPDQRSKCGLSIMPDQLPCVHVMAAWTING